jgi:cbb3-type cytochrome oxidase maturation protein
MSVIVLLIAAGGAVAGGFLWAFVWAVRSGQFDDMASPPLRMLFDDAPCPSRPSASAARSHARKEGHPHVH